MSSELKTRRHGSSLVLTLSNPATRNSLSEQLLSAAVEALNVAEPDDEIRAVVVCGEGQHFCGGVDFGDAPRLRASTPVLDRFQELVEALRTFPKPVIAAVEGAAEAHGFSLVLACDLVVAAEDAHFIVSHASAGLIPAGGATWQLANALPRPLAHQWAWFGESLGAQHLHAHGFVNWLTGRGQALRQALDVAERVAWLPANALAVTKELLRDARTTDFTRHLDAERRHFIERLLCDAGEDPPASGEKRPRRF